MEAHRDLARGGNQREGGARVDLDGERLRRCHERAVLAWRCGASSALHGMHSDLVERVHGSGRARKEDPQSVRLGRMRGVFHAARVVSPHHGLKRASPIERLASGGRAVSELALARVQPVWLSMREVRLVNVHGGIRVRCVRVGSSRRRRCCAGTLAERVAGGLRRATLRGA